MAERGQRRSARISELDARRAQQGTTSGGGPGVVEKWAAVGQDSNNVQKLPERKRGRKKRRLRPVDEVVGSSVARVVEQASEIPENEDHPSNTSQPSTVPPVSRMPEKRLLEHILDVLQMKDSHEIFAEPVDPEEVEGYYEIIKEPMDFGTMRAKLQEGMYTTVEQFEHDVFLISSNAMHFNSSGTIFFRQARALNEQAKKVFHALKTDPENLEFEFPVMRRRPGRRPKCEAGVLGSSSRAKLATNVRPSSITSAASNGRPCSLHGPSSLRRNIQAYPGASTSSSLIDRRDYEYHSGFRDGKRSNFSEAERRTYRPWTSFLSENESLASTVYNDSKSLMHANQGGIGYKESLMQFVKDLGPTAQMVANRKLQRCQVSVQVPNCQIPAMSAQQRPTPPTGVVNTPASRNFLDNLSSRPSVLTSTVEGRVSRGAFRGEMGYKSQSSGIQLGSHLPIPYVGGLNFPAGGMTRSGSEYLAMVNSSKLDSLVRPTEMASEISQSRLLDFVSRNSDCSGSSSLPFQVMGASSSRQATGSMHDLVSYSLGEENQAMATPGPSYGGSLVHEGLVSEWSRPSLGSHYLAGENQTMAAPGLSYGVSSGLVGPVQEWSRPSLGSHSLRGQNDAMAAPGPSYRVSSAQAGPVPEWSRPSLGSHSLIREHQAMDAPGPGYGVGSTQAGPVPEWSHRSWPPQAVFDMPYLQTRLSEMNSLGRNVFVQSEMQLGSASQSAFLDPMGFYERVPTHNQQAELSTLALLDNQQPDLALQL